MVQLSCNAFGPEVRKLHLRCPSNNRRTMSRCLAAFHQCSEEHSVLYGQAPCNKHSFACLAYTPTHGSLNIGIASHPSSAGEVIDVLVLSFFTLALDRRWGGSRTGKSPLTLSETETQPSSLLPNIIPTELLTLPMVYRIFSNILCTVQNLLMVWLTFCLKSEMS